MKTIGTLTWIEVTCSQQVEDLHDNFARQTQGFSKTVYGLDVDC